MPHRLRWHATVGGVALRLGMTSGAFVAFVFIYIVAVFGFWKLYDLQAQNRRLAQANAATIRRVDNTQTQVILLARQGVDAHRGLCATKRSLEGQVRAAERSLHLLKLLFDQHPEGVFGLSAAGTRAVIASSERDQADRLATLKSLATVTCP